MHKKSLEPDILLLEQERTGALHEAEDRALALLSKEIAENPRGMLQKLVEMALELCNAGTAGISLLEVHNGKEYFRWEALATGRRYVTTDMAERILNDFERADRPVRLSNREYEVLYLLGSGLVASEIADRLSLSVKTISTYRSRLLEKLHLRNNGQLMKYAYKEGIVS